MSFGVNVLGLPAAHNMQNVRFQYPPPDLASAWELSKSKAVADVYKRSEKIMQQQQPPAPNFLPDYAGCFPNGQLSAFASMGRYHHNVERYLKLFGQQQVHFVKFDQLTKDVGGVLREITTFLNAPPAVAAEAIGIDGEAAADLIKPVQLNSTKGSPKHQNTGSGENEEFDELSLKMAAYYAPHNQILETMIGMKLGWNELPLYRQAKLKITQAGIST